MDFGVVLQTDPPASRVIELTKQAEALGFSHAWTWDSHVLWQEPFVIYSRMLAETDHIVVGPMVTNPGSCPRHHGGVDGGDQRAGRR
jgi:alkanesulfonate monooxygenase SsuD/methylene tetrahydromethanopterin reductase-like flavin-dependent oxidoreductase (luciferase family)